MLTATSDCGAGIGGYGTQQALLVVLPTVLLGGFCLGWLYTVALQYPGVGRGTRRSLGRLVSWLAGLSFLGFAASGLVSLNLGCGSEVRRVTGSITSWLLLAGITMFISGVLLLRPRAGWVAGATVVTVDAALAVLSIALPASSARGIVVMLFAVHGVCTAVATWWARQLRGASDPLPAKAAEASRTLCASWIIVGLLLIADRHDSRLLPDSSVVGLFVAAAISLVLGSGYTRYAEARAEHVRQGAAPPDPDGLTHLLRGVMRRASRLAEWAIQYREDF